MGRYPPVLRPNREGGMEARPLCDLYETFAITLAIIYCNTRHKVDFLADEMAKREFTNSTMHAEMAEWFAVVCAGTSDARR